MKKENFWSEFGIEVKLQLLRRGMKQNELIEKVSKDTGLYFDDSYLYKILRGERSPNKIVQSICKILEIEMPENYERRTDGRTSNF